MKIIIEQEELKYSIPWVAGNIIKSVFGNTTVKNFDKVLEFSPANKTEAKIFWKIISKWLK